LRIGLVNEVVPKDQLLETCFHFVDRVAHISPETVKINLQISTVGLEMMGLRKAWTLNSELAAMARLTKREEFNKRLEEAKKKGGLAFLRATARFNRSRSDRKRRTRTGVGNRQYPHLFPPRRGRMRRGLERASA
jgi:hypothetical protein